MVSNPLHWPVLGWGGEGGGRGGGRGYPCYNDGRISVNCVSFVYKLFEILFPSYVPVSYLDFNTYTTSCHHISCTTMLVMPPYNAISKLDYSGFVCEPSEYTRIMRCKNPPFFHPTFQVLTYTCIVGWLLGGVVLYATFSDGV